MFTYRKPEGVQVIHRAERPLLTTPQGGRVALDNTLHALWETANQRTLDEILKEFKAEYASDQTIRAGLACLAEAGLLIREGIHPPEKLLPERTSGPRVAAIIVSYNSREWLQDCLPSLLAQTYAPIEIIVVDNGSQDDTLTWLEQNYPQVKRIRLTVSASLSHAINCGAEQAAGSEYLLLLNPDITLEPDAVYQLVKSAEEDPECAAVAAKLRFTWAPAFLNGLGNQVGPFSWGTDNALGHLDLGQFDHVQEVPSACFAATLIRTAVWKKIGPADEGFPMYYEDAEWCYRARVLGYRIKAAPQAVIYHAFSGRTPTGDPEPLTPRKLKNVVYGRLRFAMKITGDQLPRFLRNYLLEDWANFSRLLLQRDWKSVRAYLGAWKDALLNLRSILEARRKLQTNRLIGDDILFGLQRELPMPYAWHGLPELTWDLVIHHYSPLIKSGKTKSMPEWTKKKGRPHLLIVSNDIIDEKMAGPGMRYLEMAQALKKDLDITLAVPAETSLKIPGLNLVRYWETRPGSLQVLVENSDIALVSGYMGEKFPFLRTTATRLIVDLYDPTILENLHYYLHEPMEAQQALNRHGINITNNLLKLGDFFICGNERQRDYWLGFLTANERINPLTFKADSTLRSLIDVVGIGFPDRELKHEKDIIRGVHPQVPADARIVLWGGGIWNWLDPLTIIKAWPQVINRHPEARLVFLGTRHPNPDVPVHEMAAKAQKLAEEIGEKDRSIIFIEWISYQDRESLLCEADVGVALHPVHVETRYSIRTRVLDYLWARLPVLVTEGDITSEWVQQYGLGEVVPPFDAQAVADALSRLLDRPRETWAPAFTPLIEHFRWSQVVEPVRRYCLEGGYAPDRQNRQIPQSSPAPQNSGYFARALYLLKTEGPRALAHRAWRHLQWRLSRP
ncbi:MAG: glycosyltransferase [Chloroflexi bacterium]|nr:glycosyltransferase [Chloroflexota bacterium]